MLTAPQFAWACADAGDYPPPEPRKGARYGDDVVCALCGGETQGVGWPRKLGLPDTLTDIPYMVEPADRRDLLLACQAAQAETIARLERELAEERAALEETERKLAAVR